jgi:hypothetical protein
MNCFCYPESSYPATTRIGPTHPHPTPPHLDYLRMDHHATKTRPCHVPLPALTRSFLHRGACFSRWLRLGSLFPFPSGQSCRYFVVYTTCIPLCTISPFEMPPSCIRYFGCDKGIYCGGSSWWLPRSKTETGLHGRLADPPNAHRCLQVHLADRRIDKATSRLISQ